MGLQAVLWAVSSVVVVCLVVILVKKVVDTITLIIIADTDPQLTKFSLSPGMNYITLENQKMTPFRGFVACQRKGILDYRGPIGTFRSDSSGTVVLEIPLKDGEADELLFFTDGAGPDEIILTASDSPSPGSGRIKRIRRWYWY